jgi:chromosome segregation ATPase
MNLTLTDGIIIALITAAGMWAGQAISLYRFRKEWPSQDRKTMAESNAANGEGLEHYANATKVLLEPLTKRVNELEKERDEKEDYYDVLKKEWGEEQDAWRKERSDLMEHIVRLEARQMVLENDIITLRGENAGLRADKIVYEKQIEEFKLKIDSLQAELESYKAN